MRTSNLLSGAVMALAIGVMTGCSDNLAVDDGQGKVDRDQTRYLNVTIVNPSAAGSRATTDGDFEYGSDDENFVQSMTFVFYDAQGLPTGQAVEKTFEKDGTTDKNKPSDGFTAGTGANVEKIWSETIPVVLAQGENLPAQVVAYINPVSNTDLKTRSLAQLDEVTRDQVTVNGTFPMSNSVYYGNNPVTGQTNVRVFATPISTDKLFTSAQAAADAPDKTVDIYVERYAARVTLNLGTGNTVIVPNATDVNGYTLTFVPEAWRINATDRLTYVVKRFGLIQDGVVNYDPAYNDIMSNFNGKDWWNEPGKFRSYWATTPSYYDNKYPTVSDNITDVAENNDYTGTTPDVDKYPYAQHYFNYKQFKTGAVNGAKFPAAILWDKDNGFNQPFYARETTTASSAWKNGGAGYNPLATMASAVIVGHYELTATGAVAPVPANDKTFYLYGKTGGKHNLYFDDANVTAEGKKGIMAAMIAQQSVVLERTGNEGNYTYTAYKGTDGFKVDHPSKEVRAVKGIKVAGRLVALQLNGSKTGLYYYNTDESRYEEITDANINKVNSDLLTADYATKYGDGIAYFNIPIEHLGGAVEKEEGKGYDFPNCPAGSFGVVRNHAYTINVTGITGLATALRDDNQPIVPPVDEVSYYINAKLNILSWRIVPAQEVEL